ncbi:MAG: glycosyltransferase family 39 protein [Gammaproteobacteria bacterium]|nr:glycosyltransferase family 39 protein [Gammaproteobacteria bacterium]
MKIDYHDLMSQRNEFTILVSLCVVLFVSSLFAYSRHNSFPYYAHADEHRKVEQLFTRDFNFNHPHLLLLSTDLVRLVRGQDDGYQRVTMSGRWVSATFAAVSIVLLTLLGWRAFGLLGAWCVGLLVMVCPIVGLTAHFLKEDTSLLLGFSASLLALDFWLDKPSSRRLVWLGLACGLAASGKYIGVLCLLAVIPLVISNVKKIQGTPWSRHLALLLVPAVFVFVVIN